MMKKEYIKPFTEVLDVYAEELMDMSLRIL